jgi:hypothetical protein
LLLSRERAKSSPTRRKVKIAAGIAKAMLRTNFGLTTPSVEIAAVRSKNEFFRGSLNKNRTRRLHRTEQRCFQAARQAGCYERY